MAQMKQQIVDASRLNAAPKDAMITHVLFIDTLTGNAERQILVNAEHFKVIAIEDDTALLVLDWASLEGAVARRAKRFLAEKDYDTHDHMKMMVTALGADVSVFDAIKMLYIDPDGVTGSYMIDLRDAVEISHEWLTGHLVIRLTKHNTRPISDLN